MRVQIDNLRVHPLLLHPRLTDIRFTCSLRLFAASTYVDRPFTQAALLLWPSHVFCLQILLPARSEETTGYMLSAPNNRLTRQMQSVGCSCRTLLKTLQVSSLDVSRIYSCLALIASASNSRCYCYPLLSNSLARTMPSGDA